MFKSKKNKNKNKVKNVPPKLKGTNGKKYLAAMANIIERIQLRNVGDIRVI